MNTPVDFTTAQLLKEKGFDKSLDTILNTVYDIEDMSLMKNVHQETLTKGKELFLHAPTIAEVVCWIYSKYQIWVQVSILKDDEWHYSIRRKDNNWNIEFPTKEKYTFMENAYEKGINVILNTYKPKS